MKYTGIEIDLSDKNTLIKINNSFIKATDDGKGVVVYHAVNPELVVINTELTNELTKVVTTKDSNVLGLCNNTVYK